MAKKDKAEKEKKAGEPQVAPEQAGEQQPEQDAKTEQPQGDAEQQAAEARAEDALKQRDEYLALAQRVQADFDNFRRRNASARQDAREEGLCEAAQAMLPVLDNLERALAAAESGAILEGVQMVHKQFVAALGSLEVEEIPADGQEFDPNLHNAVMQEAAPEDELSGKVAMVLQKGYRRGNRVLRCSMVKVYM